MGNGGAVATTYSLAASDFEAFTKAMVALPVIQRRVIQDIAKEQAIYHIGVESQFWRGVADGCGIN